MEDNGRMLYLKNSVENTSVFVGSSPLLNPHLPPLKLSIVILIVTFPQPLGSNSSKAQDNVMDHDSFIEKIEGFEFFEKDLADWEKISDLNIPTASRGASRSCSSHHNARMKCQIRQDPHSNSEGEEV